MQDITDVQGAFKLNNGIEIPYLGLGVYLAEDGNEVINAIKWAVDAGYRHIDTAKAYDNEEGVGKGIAQCGVDRNKIFITSKVWNNDQGYDATLKAFDKTMERLNMDTLDLYLIHWPVEGKYKETWRALEKIYNDKRVRAIGVSNFMQHHLEDLLKDASVVPAINQCEFHPWLVQHDLKRFCLAKNIQFEAWSPLMQGKAFGNKKLKEIGKRYNKTEGQVVLRWNLQKGVVTIPKSVKKEHIEANAAIFDFELNEMDIQQIDAMNKNERLGPDPDNFDF